MGTTKPRSITLRSGDMQAEVNTLGAGIKALTHRGEALVETYEQLDRPPLAAGLWLAPWPNRTEDGTFSFAGAKYQLELTEPERNNAIHGLVHDQVWTILQHHDDAAVLSTDVPAANGWPWPITLSVHYALNPEALVATVMAETTAPTAPFGLGWHTYLSAKGAATDRSRLKVNVEKQQPLDPQRNLPEGPLQATERARMLREGTSLNGVVMDDCFHTSEGLVAELTSDHGGVRMVCEDQFRWVQIFTPDEAFGVTYPGRGRAVAVEPMTVPPNALRSGTDLHVLRNPGVFSSTVKLQVLH